MCLVSCLVRLKAEFLSEHPLAFVSVEVSGRLVWCRTRGVVGLTRAVAAWCDLGWSVYAPDGGEPCLASGMVCTLGMGASWKRANEP